MADTYQLITARIIEQLERGTSPWHKPWTSRGASALPRNLVSGRHYRGINTWMLLSAGFTSPCWLTYRQAQDLGGHVRKGETGTPVVFWRFGKYEVHDGDAILEKSSVLCRHSTAFNLEQCEGIASPDPVPEPVSNSTPIDACERIVQEWAAKPTILYGGDRASYAKTLDIIRMPYRECFDRPEDFHSTRFHECIHGSGHPTRLNRSTLTETEYFGDENYSREELVAELGASFLCGITGIENRTIASSAAYLRCWLKVLKSDSRLVIVAAGQAQRAVDHILGVAASDAVADDSQTSLAASA